MSIRDSTLGGGEGGERLFGGLGRMLCAVLWSMGLRQRMALLAGIVRPELLQSLAEILERPGVTPAVDRCVPLEQAADAMRLLVAGQVRGKLVLRVG